MTIRSFLDLSTTHMPHTNVAKEIADYVLAEGDEDLFVWVPEQDHEDTSLPTWFKEVCEFALTWGCYYIRFTPLGTKYDELEQFDWE